MQDNREDIVNFREQLAKRAFGLNVEFLVTAGSFWGALYFLRFVGMDMLWSLLIGYEVVMAGRFLYDQYIVREPWLEDALPIMKLVSRLGNNVMGIVLIGMLYYFDRTNFSLENWALLLTIIFWRRDVYPLKARKPYAEELPWLLMGVYGFLGIVALISIQLTKMVGGPYFYLVFAGAVYVGLICEYIFDLLVVYEIKLAEEADEVWMPVLLALLGSVLCLGFVYILTQIAGLSATVAGISAVVAMRLFQPLSMQLILRR